MKRYWPLLLLVFGILAIYAVYEYQRPVASAAEQDATEVVTASELHRTFIEAEGAANDRFTDKVIQVTGVVRSVEEQNGSVDVMLELDDPLAAIACEFKDPISELPAAGGSITLKGICAGYNGFDVVLQRCALVE